MSVVGIVCEYNPFHRGHLDHIRQSRAAAGGDAPVVCVMSGDFVQRGTPAVFDKHVRARAACACGADLVIELPLPWCVSSAERFARGGVGLLNDLGVVTHLSFGSEAGDLAPLTALALEAMEPETIEAVKDAMSGGMGFAPARQRALEEKLGRECAGLLEKPNNILAVEYLKALFSLNAALTPVTTRRTGSVHDGSSDGAFRCAAEIRSMLEAEEDVSPYLPAAAQEVLRGCEPMYMEKLEQAYMARLRMLPEEAFHALPDATEGLGNRLYRAVRTEPGVEAVLSAIKTKRYPMSRLRRMLTCAALGVRAGEAEERVPYARVLAASGAGRALLREMDGKSAVHHKARRRQGAWRRGGADIHPDGGRARLLRSRPRGDRRTRRGLGLEVRPGHALSHGGKTQRDRPPF